MSQGEPFSRVDGIFVPRVAPPDRSEEFDFDQLARMQDEHFWYRGRHRFILSVLRAELARSGRQAGLRAIDMGGGCGGWLRYLQAHAGGAFAELALGDSSLRALTLAGPVVGSFASRYQIDLLDLAWQAEWDVVFLLDVLEHIPDHEAVLAQVRKSLRPGGLIFVTTPALRFFWTYNDEVSGHQRRYSRQDFRDLAGLTGLELVRADYFMFFLSPLLLLQRLLSRPKASATPEERQEHVDQSHRTPAAPINEALAGIFSLEARLAGKVRFPWGTSILAVLRR